MSIEINEQDIRKHYEWLNHNSETEIRIIIDKSEQNNFSEIERSKSFFIHNIVELLKLCKEWNGKRHIYIAINERKNKGKKTEDIETIKNFVIDIDNKGDFLKTQETALKIKDDAEIQGFKEPLLICSGNGFHLYFALEDLSNNEQTREKIKTFGNKLKKKYETKDSLIDSAVFEVARVMRLAGTINIKPEVKTLCTIINKENKRINDNLLTEELLAINPDTSIINFGELEISLAEVLEKDERVKSLFSAGPEAMKKFPSRSEAEESLVCHLIGLGLDKEKIFKVMSSCKIGKWQEANIGYRDLTYEKAVKLITNKKRNIVLAEKNPFKKLHYATQHLTCFNELNLILGLFGRQYLPIKKARWYQLVGGIMQKKIKLGNKSTDTRISCIFPLPTEQGKNDLIYLFKDIASQVRKNKSEIFSVEEPLSYHPEQLIGKVIEVMIDNPTGNKPKKIPEKRENRGFFNSDFIEIDEANLLFFSKDEQIKQAREYISKALNPIDRNEVIKKLVDDLPDERVAYFPRCTFSLYYQPTKKLDEELFLQGFLRRFLIPVGSIEPFLNYGNEEDFKRKISIQQISKQQMKENLIDYLDKVRERSEDCDIVFKQEAIEKINYYLQFLIAEGQIHSEKISNLTKLIKWTIQDYLIRMSCILAGSFYKNVVDENIVALAYMDLVELLQSTFDFIKEWVYGNFDYGSGWQGANYKEKLCLEYLYDKKSFSAESSSVSIAEFEQYIIEIYKIKETRARQIFADFKKKNLVDSKQINQYETKVWLTFVPQIENMVFQGDKGVKGYNLYESVFSAINGILTNMSALSPLSPSDSKMREFVQGDNISG